MGISSNYFTPECVVYRYTGSHYAADFLHNEPAICIQGDTAASFVNDIIGCVRPVVRQVGRVT